VTPQRDRAEVLRPCLSREPSFHGRLGGRGTNLRQLCGSSGRSGSFVLLRRIQTSAITSQTSAIGKRITVRSLAPGKSAEPPQR